MSHYLKGCIKKQRLPLLSQKNYYSRLKYGFARGHEAYAYVENIRAEYLDVANKHARAEADKKRLPLAQARDNAIQIDWSGFEAKTPQFLGARVINDFDLAEIARYIDWTPFFQTWELKGVYPRILEDEKQGEVARQLFADAQAMLARIIAEKWFTPRAVIGFWPANRIGDDIQLWRDERRADPLATLHTLRQQVTKRDGRPNAAMADFVAPAGHRDYVGGFVVTAGGEEQALAERFGMSRSPVREALIRLAGADDEDEFLHASSSCRMRGHSPRIPVLPPRCPRCGRCSGH